VVETVMRGEPKPERWIALPGKGIERMNVGVDAVSEVE
jgi:hypothetical protein